MRLIDADALMARLRKAADDNPGTIASALCELVCGDIEIEPEAIVKCKDCKHRPTGDVYNHDLKFPDFDYKCPCRCEDYWYSWMPDDNWYCANGERRTDETG